MNPDQIILLVMTDGRDDLLFDAIASFDEMVAPRTVVTTRLVHDDTGDTAHRRELDRRLGIRWHVFGRGPRRGFGGAIRYAWQELTNWTTHRWVFHLEDDFVFERPVDLGDLVDLSIRRPELAQVALRRQPWNPEEEAAGGFVEAHPDAYVEVNDGRHTWVQTVRNWTTNPSLYRRQLCELGWPDDPHSEGRFGFELRYAGLPWDVPGDQVRFGYYGGLQSGREWVRHVGHNRVGTGY